MSFHGQKRQQTNFSNTASQADTRLARGS